MILFSYRPFSSSSFPLYHHHHLLHLRTLFSAPQFQRFLGSSEVEDRPTNTHTHPRRKQRKQKIRSSFSSSCLAGNCLFYEFVLRPGEDEEIHKIQLQEEDTKWICLVIRRSPPHSLVHSSIPISRLVKFCRPILNPQERRRCTDFPPHTILLVVVQ